MAPDIKPLPTKNDVLLLTGVVYLMILGLTFSMYCQCRGPHVIVRATVCNDDHDLAFVGFGLAEELIGSKRDSRSCAGSAAPVVYTLDGVEQVSFVIVLSESKLQPLLVRVLYDSHARVRVRDLELPRHVRHELQHGAEVSRPHAAGAVDDEGDVVGVEAGLTAHQALCVAHSLHQRLRGFPQSKPARYREREEAVGPAHGLRSNKRSFVTTHWNSLIQ